MRQVSNYLFRANNGRGEPPTLKPTHYYIKFYPKTEEEADELDRLGIELYTYPIDKNETPEHYIDPEKQADQPDPLYCAVPVDFKWPVNIEYKKLETLYLPKTDKGNTELKAAALENTALGISDGANNNPIGSTHFLPSKWRPSGRIRVFDPNKIIRQTRNVLDRYEEYPCPDQPPCGLGCAFATTDVKQNFTSSFTNGIEMCTRPVYRREVVETLGGMVPIEGVRVKARRYFTTYTGITNSQGYFSVDGEFRYDANYDFDWERDGFVIRDQHFIKARTPGPKKRGAWNLDMHDWLQQYHSSIFRAAYRYYYGDIGELQVRPESRIENTKMRIRARLGGERGDSHYFPLRALANLHSITIFQGQPVNQNTIDYYDITIHELAHSAQARVMSHLAVGSKFLTNRRYLESWAVGVAWYLTNLEYPGYRGVTPSTNYTHIILDLIDNATANNSGLDMVSGDNVDGFSMGNLEIMYFDSRQSNFNKNSWHQFRDFCKANLPVGVSQNEVQLLFNSWENF